MLTLMRTFLKLVQLVFKSLDWKTSLWVARSPDSDHVHAVYPKMTGQWLTQLWWMLQRLYSLFEVPRGLYMTKCHKKEPWIQQQCERREVTNTTQQRGNFIPDSGRWTVNINLLLVSLTYEGNSHYIITKEKRLFYKMYLLAIKSYCLDQVMTTAG